MAVFKPWGTGGDAAEKIVKSCGEYFITTSASGSYILKHTRFGFLGYCESIAEGEEYIQKIKGTGTCRL
jgi:hypothetical protein